MSDNFSKRIAYSLATWVAYFFTFVVNRVPRRTALGFGSFLGYMVYCLVPRHRRIARDNLRHAYPEMSVNERRKLVRRIYRHWGRSGVEVARLWTYHKRGGDGEVVFEGLEHLALAAKGGVLATCHLGAFPLLGLHVNSQGYDAVWVIRMPNSSGLYRWTEEMLVNARIKWLSDRDRSQTVRETISVLRDGRIMALMVDQNHGSESFVEFFGRQAGTALGPATLAKRIDVPLLPACIYWGDDDKHHVVIKPPLKTRESDPKKAALDLMTQATRQVEEWVRAHPEQWLWLHRRWKDRPSEES